MGAPQGSPLARPRQHFGIHKPLPSPPPLSVCSQDASHTVRVRPRWKFSTEAVGVLAGARDSPGWVAGGASGPPWMCPSTHLPREVTLLVEVHVLVLLAEHPQAQLERLLVSVEAKLEFTQAVEELGQVAAHLGWGRGQTWGRGTRGFGGGAGAAWFSLGGVSVFLIFGNTHPLL